MEPPVDQKLLEDFLSLCRHRSFSHAAQERNVTQPAFSRRIRALEEWLGVVLFDRTALPVRLTAQGEQFLPVARDIVDRMAEARREFAAGNRSDGIVRLISLPYALYPQLQLPCPFGDQAFYLYYGLIRYGL